MLTIATYLTYPQGGITVTDSWGFSPRSVYRKAASMVLCILFTRLLYHKGDPL